ncbi:hypothetical protein [Lignipirellula cremea]|uniref:Uncharacterized protein n=1 Tax=Lignipirellula cremea TaxID=2528010 RepID=A0A518E1R1_9BACT|nr:hypothetical protein [Lignipirellula cremea]QDU98014.1 hypothetical protein Pla8534_58750 [Lignipirellula cremea]
MQRFTTSLVFSLALSTGWQALAPGCLRAEEGIPLHMPVQTASPIATGAAPGDLLSRLLPDSGNPIVALRIEPQLRFSGAPYRSSYGASPSQGEGSGGTRATGKNRMDPHSREAAPLPPPTPPVDMRETVASDQIHQAAEQKQSGIASPGRSAPSPREPVETLALPVASPESSLEATDVQVLPPRPTGLPAFVPRPQPTPGPTTSQAPVNRQTAPHCAVRPQDPSTPTVRSSLLRQPDRQRQ